MQSADYDRFLEACRPLALYARAAIALLVLEKFCLEHGIHHSELDRFFDYMWKGPSSDFAEWEASKPPLVVYGIGGGAIPAELTPWHALGHPPCLEPTCLHSNAERWLRSHGVDEGQIARSVTANCAGSTKPRARRTPKPPIHVGGRSRLVNQAGLGFDLCSLNNRATPMPCSHCCPMSSA